MNSIHEDISTTNIYLRTDNRLKNEVISKLSPRITGETELPDWSKDRGLMEFVNYSEIESPSSSPISVQKNDLIFTITNHFGSISRKQSNDDSNFHLEHRKKSLEDKIQMCPMLF